MKLTHILGAVAVAVGLLSAQTASAAMILGSIEVDAKTVTPSPTPLGSATQLTFTQGFVSAGALDLAVMVDPGLSFTPATWISPFTFNPNGVPYITLWTATRLGNTASFDLLTMNIVTQTDNDLIISGTGIIKLTGFDNTPGTFRLSVNNPDGGSTFGFTSTAAALPEGGTAIALLGLGLLGLEGARRRLKTPKA